GAVLRGLARLWRCKLDLVALGATIGSDVPFFAAGADFALVEGRGERVRALRPPGDRLWIVLVRVAARVATADVFAALRSEEWSDGRSSAALAAAFGDGSVTHEIVRMRSRNDIHAAACRVCR